jgi:2-dehydropantoate 2-reductase
MELSMVVLLHKPIALFAMSRPDIQIAIWEKLIFVEPWGAVGAFKRQSVKLLRESSDSRALLSAAMQEILNLANASGVPFRQSAIHSALHAIDNLQGESVASMQRDILQGVPSELDTQTGAVLRAAQTLSFPLPVHKTIYDALIPLQRRARETFPNKEKSPRMKTNGNMNIE